MDLKLGMADSDNVTAGDYRGCVDDMTVEVSAVAGTEVLQPPGALPASDEGVL